MPVKDGFQGICSPSFVRTSPFLSVCQTHAFLELFIYVCSSCEDIASSPLRNSRVWCRMNYDFLLFFGYGMLLKFDCHQVSRAGR